MEDGGYYALKGFDFQIDKTIYEIFSTVSDSEEISVENIQDVSSNEFVTQVKYKETQKFEYSKIRDPVVQLINESEKDGTDRIYVLYCYFSDKPESTREFDVAGLDEILKIKLFKNCSEAHRKKVEFIKKIPFETKSKFSTRFKLVFAPKHEVQFKGVLDIIAGQDFCQSEAEAIFYYCYIADFLRRLVISTANPEDRKCARKDLIKNIKDKKRQFFHSTLSQFNGKKALMLFLRERFDRPLPFQNSLIFIGQQRNEAEIINLITLIVEQRFNNATHDAYPPTFVVNKDVALSVKKGLIDKNITFNDGFEEINFSEVQFNRRHIALRKLNASGKPLESLGNISYKLRIVTPDNFQASRAGDVLPDRVYYFDFDEISSYLSVPSFQVDGLSCEDIWQLFKR